MVAVDSENEDEVAPGATPRTKRRAISEADKEKVKLLNWPQTYITLIKGFVCTGILYLPTAYWNGGYIFSIVALFLAYVLTIVCGMKLIEVSRLDEYKGMSFSEIGEALYGKKGRYAADAAIIGS